MHYEFTLWIVVIASAMHVLEEQMLDWVDWARSAIGLPVTWENFYTVNAAFIVGGIAMAMIGWRLPEVSLMLPAVVVVNAIFFHIVISIVQRRFSPGTITATLLYLPTAAWAYCGAYLDGVLTVRAALVSAAGGIVLMAYPILLLRLAAALRTRKE